MDSPAWGWLRNRGRPGFRRGQIRALLTVRGSSNRRRRQSTAPSGKAPLPTATSCAQRLNHASNIFFCLLQLDLIGSQVSFALFRERAGGPCAGRIGGNNFLNSPPQILQHGDSVFLFFQFPQDAVFQPRTDRTQWKLDPDDRVICAIRLNATGGQQVIFDRCWHRHTFNIELDDRPASSALMLFVLPNGFKSLETAYFQQTAVDRVVSAWPQTLVHITIDKGGQARLRSRRRTSTVLFCAPRHQQCGDHYQNPKSHSLPLIPWMNQCAKRTDRLAVRSR